MRGTSVFLLAFALCANAIAQMETKNPDSHHREFEVEQAIGENSSISFTIKFGNDEISKSEIFVETQCKDKQRTLSVSDSSLELIAKKYFPNGNVLQYVVRLKGEDVAFIKIEKETCTQDRHCLQPRILLTDTSDRIIAQVANAENEERKIILRDNLSQTVMRGELVKDAKWKVGAVTISPLLSALVVCAASIDRKLCKEPKKVETHSKKAIACGTLIAAVTSIVFFKYVRRHRA